uniref:Uncharacterized protein n=1 Tax=Anguilla anguilla TaxID=7936 RepID=A0A0E9XQP5_ANGAN
MVIFTWSENPETRPFQFRSSQ